MFLKGGSDNDASLVISRPYSRGLWEISKCEVIEGLEDDTAVVALDLQGKYCVKLRNDNQSLLFFMTSNVQWLPQC